MVKYQHLSPKALAAAMAMLGSVIWVIAVIWHGLMTQPSMMGYMYPRFSFINPLNAVALLVVLVISFYIIGWLVATFYNWALKRK